MITFILICSNQLTLLKQRLFYYSNLANNLSKSEIIIIDDGSIDSTSNYVKTHFPKIKYMKNINEEGYINCFNKALDFATNNFIFFIDLHISIKALNLKKEINNMKKNDSFIHIFPITQTYKSKFQTINYTNSEFKFYSTTNPIDYPVISEALIVNKNKLKLISQLPTHYFGIRFAVLDLIISGKKLGHKTSYSNESYIKKQDNRNSFFSYPIEKWVEFKDSLIFQWKHCNSFSFKIKRAIYLSINCLSFKPKKLKHISQAYISWLFSNKKKYNWYIYKDTDIFPKQKKAVYSQLANFKNQHG